MTDSHRSALKRKIARELRDHGFGGTRDKISVYNGEDEDLHVLSPRFSAKNLEKRGELIWSVLFRSLPQEDWGQVSLTRGFTPDEPNGASEAESRLRT
jgi:hypothetical protein